jgi:hypothetical protein
VRKELHLSVGLGLGEGCRFNKRMNKILGPVLGTPLLLGEKVAVRRRRVLSWKGRCVVRVRVVGVSSLGWVDAFILWCACVEAFICQGGNVRHLVEQLYPDTYIAPLDKALCIPPLHGWDGILAGTLLTQDDADHFRQLVKAWRPTLVLITSHSSLPRKTLNKWLLFQDLQYIHFAHACHHEKFGGVTNSAWRLAIGLRNEDSPLDASLTGMTAGLYPRNRLRWKVMQKLKLLEVMQ